MDPPDRPCWQAGEDVAQPSEGIETDDIFDGVVIDADAAVLRVDLKLWPEVESVGDGQAHGALRQVGAAPLQAAQGFAEALEDHAAVAGTDGLTEPGAGAALAQLGLDSIKVPDLQEDKSGMLRGVGFGFEKLAADMRPAGCQADILAGAGKGGIGLVTITLDDAAKGGGDDVIKACGRAAGVPVLEGFAAGTFAGP